MDKLTNGTKNTHFQNMYIKVKHPDTYDEVGYNMSDD